MDKIVTLHPVPEAKTETNKEVIESLEAVLEAAKEGTIQSYAIVIQDGQGVSDWNWMGAIHPTLVESLESLKFEYLMQYNGRDDD